jgi:hypothetical protein
MSNQTQTKTKDQLLKEKIEKARSLKQDKADSKELIKK